MPTRFALIPLSCRRSPAVAALPDYAALIDALHASRALCAGGPQVLALVNDLVLLCEDMLEFSESPDGTAPGSACCPDAERFLADLTGHLERIRTGSGELDDAFFDLVKSLPGTVNRNAA